MEVALKDLRRLTMELEELAHMLRTETRRQARWLIIRRVNEIMRLIGEGMQK